MSADRIGHIKDAFLKHPSLVAVLLILLGCGYLVNEHNELRALVVTSFQTLPSGWMVLSIGGLITSVWHLFREVKKCHDERLADRKEWERDRDRLLQTISEKEERMNEAQDAVQTMFDRLLKPRQNHKPMPGGQRSYDPKN